MPPSNPNQQGPGGDPRWQPGGQFYTQFYGSGPGPGGNGPTPFTPSPYGGGPATSSNQGTGSSSPTPPPTSKPPVVTSQVATNDFNNKKDFLSSTENSIANQAVAKSAPPAFPVKGSIVDFLKTQGKPSDFASRAQMAKEYGISNYSGSAQQNGQLLSILSSQSTNGVSTTNAVKTAVSSAMNPPATPSQTSSTDPNQSSADTDMANYQGALGQMNEATDEAYSKFQSDMESLRNGTFPLSSTENAIVSSAQTLADSLRQQQIQANTNYSNGVEAATISMGLNRYSPIIAQGMIANAVNVGIQKLADLDAKSVKEIAELKEGFFDKDYTRINNSYEKTQSYLKDRTDAIQKMHDTIVAAAKDLRDFNYKAEQDKISNQLNSDKFSYQQKQDAIDNGFKSRQIDETQRHNLQEELLEKRKQDLEYATDPVNATDIAADPSKIPGVTKTQHGVLYFDPSQFSDKKEAARAEKLARAQGIPILGDVTDRTAMDGLDTALSNLENLEQRFTELAPQSVGGKLYQNAADPLSKAFDTDFGSKLKAYQQNRDSIFQQINALAGSHPRINTIELQNVLKALPSLDTSGHGLLGAQGNIDTLKDGQNKIAITRALLYNAIRTVAPNANLPQSGDKIYGSTDELLKVHPDRAAKAAQLAQQGYNDEDIRIILNY